MGDSADGGGVGVITESTESLDLATWPIFYGMSQRGMYVSTERLQSLRNEVIEKADAVLATVHGSSTIINPGSSREVAAWLESQGFGGKRTASGDHLATDERSLKAHKHPVIDAVLEYRGLTKLVGTFIDPTLEIAIKTGGTVHPKWRLTKVRSGRVATEDPNLLAFPSRDEMGRKVRSCFMARPYRRLVSIDFSQLEPRIVAALSQDPKLLAIYRDGRDLYDEIAADLSIKRQAAKIVTLGVLYGMAAKRLMEQLQLAGMSYTQEFCEALIAKWFDTYIGVKDLVARVISEAKEKDGWVYTTGGRGRYLPGLFLDGWGWPSATLREEAERQAFNHVIQGTGMEQLREAMLRVKDYPYANLLLAIHDELLFEVPMVGAEDHASALAARVTAVFQGVKLATSTSIADDWGSLKG